MTDLFIDLHHKKCKYNGKSVKILSIEMESGDTKLECGGCVCKVTIDLDKFTCVI